MPTFTSITALGKSYYLKLFPDLTKAFDGDNCASGIISVLDFLTTSKKESMHAAGEDDGLLWIEITLDRLCYMMDNMYSIRRTQDRLDALSNHRLIIMPEGQKIYGRETDKRLNFLLNVDLVESLVLSGKQLILKAVISQDIE